MFHPQPQTKNPMKKEDITKFTNLFDSIKHQTSSKNQPAVEFWYARDLQKLFEYKDWRNFLSAINKSKESCQGAKYKVPDHFVDVNNMVLFGY